MEQYLKIGLIQPAIDPDISWTIGPEKYSINVNPLIQERVWQQIERGIRELYITSEHPDIILIPELHLPHHYKERIRRFSRSIGSIIIAGTDFEHHWKNREYIRNRAFFTVPDNWPDGDYHSYAASLKPGKTFFTYMERSMFKNMKFKGIRCKEYPETNMYLFDAGKFGKFGFIICSDFFDLERLLMYQGNIHHLIIISLNKDVSTYYHMAEAIGRTVYCNVILCNTGFYGGSFVFSPYKENYKRTLYRHEGGRTFTTQLIKVPVRKLETAQLLDYSIEQEMEFKATPPGYPRKPNKQKQ